MEDLIKNAYGQLGSIALLIGFMFWIIREKNKREIADRRRIDQLTDRVFTLAGNIQQTALTLSAAVEKLRHLRLPKK